MLRCTNEKTNIKLQKTNKFQIPIQNVETEKRKDKETKNVRTKEAEKLKSKNPVKTNKLNFYGD